MQRDTPTPVEPPSALAEDVKAVLNRLTWHAIRFLDVKAQGGVVTVSGCVRSYYEKQVAYQAANHMLGVSRVIDQVEVCRH